jgi:hypothetical protein
MINKQYIEEMARKVFKHERGLVDPQIMHPTREWLVGLVVMILVFAAIAAWSAQTYLENRNISVDSVSASDIDSTTYREAQVEEALRMIVDREAELQNLLGVAPATPTVSEEIKTTSTTTTTTTSTTTIEAEEELGVETSETSGPRLGE